MGMMIFAGLFPEIAMRETRSVIVFEDAPDTAARLGLPPDEYAFLELYCTERGCDCRRVMINVLGRDAAQHLATINHAFEPPAPDDPVPGQTFLDPLNRQSPLSAALLDLFVNRVLPDEEYRQRLWRHYRIFKNVVDDPAHPAHALLHVAPGTAPEPRSRKRQPIPPPPPRSGKRKKWR